MRSVLRGVASNPDAYLMLNVRAIHAARVWRRTEWVGRMGPSVAGAPVVIAPLAAAIIGGLLLAVAYPGIITFLNPAIVPAASSLILLKWTVFGTATFRLLLSKDLWRRGKLRWATPLACLGAVALASSFDGGSFNSLSLLKLTAFVVGFSVIFSSLDQSKRTPQYWVDWFFTLHSAVLLASIPLLLLPAGRARNGVAFQGVFEHPQAFGVYLAFFTAYITASWFCGNRQRHFTLMTIPVGWSFVAFSACRTAVIAMLLAVAATAMTIAFTRRDLIAGTRSRGVRQVLLLLLCCLVMISVALFSHEAIAGVASFFRKGSEVTESGSTVPYQIFSAARGELMGRRMETFHQHPWLGGGFGLASYGVDQDVLKSDTLGIPVSAAVEDGFLITAVLGQTGLLGLLSTALLVGCIGRRVLRRGSAPVIILFFTALLVNLGEMIFFSIGGMGSQMWMIVAFCYGSLSVPDHSRRLR